MVFFYEFKCSIIYNKEKMDFKIPDKLTFKRKETINITSLDGKVLDYWEKEFGVINPVINKVGEKFYTRRDIEVILKIKQLLIVEKLEKSRIKKIIKNGYGNYNDNITDSTKLSTDKLKTIKTSLKEILTIIDKNGKE
jgi:DNA-binding transcriptional MerR regulator